MLPPEVFAAIAGGKEAGVTAADNVAAYSELTLFPRIAGLPTTPSLSTTVMGVDISFPVLVSPTGVQAVHPEGELAVARAAAAAGTAMGLSSFAAKPIELVGALTDRLLFQLYWIGNRDEIGARIERARAAGARGLILTLDWVFDARRDWGVFAVPERIDLSAAVRYAPQVLAHPAYLGRWLRHGALPDLTVPNLAVGADPAPLFSRVYRRWRATPSATWSDIAWVREVWGGPFMVKGITHVDDARRAADAGATAISVSNHGGNNLDSTPATIRCLPAIAKAVGDQMEVVLDGGIRRGTDVVKALALGARAVMIGRPCLWGLAADGERGVSRVLAILRDGMTETLRGLGRSAVGQLRREDIAVPDSFTACAETATGASGGGD